MEIIAVGIMNMMKSIARGNRFAPTWWSISNRPLRVGSRTQVFLQSVPRRPYATTSDAAEEYDYVIVGAGSAGCVLANRLSAQPTHQVALLEAGGKDSSWKFHMPAALERLFMNPEWNWSYLTTPQKHMDGRQLAWLSGKALGGSSSTNMMVHVRGHPYDYDRWEEQGAAGWSYADCLPYFKKSQTHQLGTDDYRGGNGPLHVSKGPLNNPLFGAFLEAGAQAGYPFTDDCNGYRQEGFCVYDRSIRNGKRNSTSTAYLVPALQRNNLHIETNVLVSRILFQGKRANGLEYRTIEGDVKRVYAHKEVILSGGTVNSPQILQLSGVGNADHLKTLGIPVVEHLPGVGENLQNHVDICIQHDCTKPVTLYAYQSKFPIRMAMTAVEWFLQSTGAAATTHLEVGAFIRSRPEIRHPDVQFHFFPYVFGGQAVAEGHAFTIHSTFIRPTSVGTLKVKSRDPDEAPLIDANYLSTETDRRGMRQCVKLAREVLSQKAFDEFRGAEIQPGANMRTDSEVDSLVRAKAGNMFHATSTCKMGSPRDPLAVVDPECRVLGLENLRVVDASVMPSVTSGGTNAPTIMIAEKAADVILGNLPLPKSPVPVWKQD